MKVLLPLNGTAASHRVLNYAGQFALRHGAELILLRAIDPLAFAGENFASLRTAHLEREIIRAAQAYLEGVAKSFRTVKVRCLCPVGPAAQTIRATALREGCDLILMAPYSYGPIVRWLIGSKAEEIAHSAPCPVMLLRDQAQPDPEHVLVPVDGSADSCSVMGRLGPYLTKNAKITVLHCTGIPRTESNEPATAEYLEKMRAALEIQMAGHPAATLEFVAQPAPAGILDWLTRFDCQLVAMATHGHDAIHPGTTTDQVARAANCPLLLFPPGACVQP